MKKILGIGALCFALIVGLSSCKKNETKSSLEEEQGSTYASVTISLSESTMRAGEDDYNKVGEWAGQDVINSVAVYLVSDGTVSTGYYAKTDFDIVPDKGNGTDNIKITPKKGIKTKAGEKIVYVLINGTKEVVEALAETDPANFKRAYTETALALANKGNKTEPVSTSADKVAKVSTEGDTKDYDVIVMTNKEEVKVQIEDNIKEPQTIASSDPKNRVKVEAKRVAARVIVTSTKAKYELKDKYSQEVLGQFTDIKWVVGQSEKSLFIQQKSTFETPSYAFVPANDDNFKTQAGAHYDYTALWRGYKDPATGISGNTMNVRANGVITDPKTDLEVKKVKGEFVLPTTHKYGDTRDNTQYRKGNTVYVLVRAKFTPSVWADPNETPTHDDGTFYYGANTQKFYKNVNSVTDPSKGGAKGQKCRKFEKGKVLYWAWLNPDNISPSEWLNSPVLRNGIYHISIKGFKTIGMNWNPLVPDDPNQPGTPIPNPDPKPEPDPNQPDEPENPIKPDDPLSTPETWMSVEVTVMPWHVHSYEIDLSI